MPAPRVRLPLFVALALLAGATRAVVRATPPPPPRLVPDAPPLCGAEAADRLVIGRCTAPGHVFAEPESVRDAMGRRLCWHTADARAFARIDGVGPRAAARLVEARDRGLEPIAGTLVTIRGVGPSLADRVTRAVTQRCPRVATPSLHDAHAAP